MDIVLGGAMLQLVRTMLRREMSHGQASVAPF